MGMGGITVVGLVAGTHYIEDIQVSVPHKVAVFIPIDAVVRSKDLYRALGQKAIFKLDGGGYDPTPNTPVQDDGRIAELVEANRVLTQQLAEQQVLNSGLQMCLVTIQQQMATIQAGVVRLEQRPAGNVMLADPGLVAKSLSEAVGRDAPMFIPSEITPKNVSTDQIQVSTQTTEGTSLSAAGSKLRELRKKPA